MASIHEIGSAGTVLLMAILCFECQALHMLSGIRIQISLLVARSHHDHPRLLSQQCYANTEPHSPNTEIHT